jgi:hypothetical protein
MGKIIIIIYELFIHFWKIDILGIEGIFRHNKKQIFTFYLLLYNVEDRK